MNYVNKYPWYVLELMNTFNISIKHIQMITYCICIRSSGTEFSNIGTSLLTNHSRLQSHLHGLFWISITDSVSQENRCSDKECRLLLIMCSCGEKLIHVRSDVNIRIKKTIRIVQTSKQCQHQNLLNIRFMQILKYTEYLNCINIIIL